MINRGSFRSRKGRHGSVGERLSAARTRPFRIPKAKRGFTKPLSAGRMGREQREGARVTASVQQLFNKSFAGGEL